MTASGKSKISRRRKRSDYFRQVRCSIFNFYLFPSERLDPALVAIDLGRLILLTV